MKKNILTCLIFFLFNLTNILASEDLLLSPPNFSYNNHKAIFVDFTKANYQLVFDFKKKVVNITSTIHFEMPQEGYPLFDSVAKPLAISLNGHKVSQKLIVDPHFVTRYRVIQKIVSAGSHKMTMTTKLDLKKSFQEIKVAVKDPKDPKKEMEITEKFFSFFMDFTDIDDRFYLERYLPSNLNYDKYTMDFHVQIQDIPFDYKMVANGKITEVQKDTFHISFPDYYRASALYFHLFEKNQFHYERLTYTTLSGKKIPVEIYTRKTQMKDKEDHSDEKLFSLLKELTPKYMNQLEAEYGQWPHDHMIVQGDYVWGGMEYSGATITSHWALHHELIHSYFARWVFPANGNAEWIDEAMTSWIEDDYPLMDLDYEFTYMGHWSPYKRNMDRDGYVRGAKFLSELDQRYKDRGGLKPFFKFLLQEKGGKAITCENFKELLEQFYQVDLSFEFDRYIYGIVDEP